MQKITEVIETFKTEKGVEGKMTKDQCVELVGIFAKEVFENHYNGKVFQLGLHVQGIDADENGNINPSAVLDAVLNKLSERLTEKMGGMGTVKMGAVSGGELPFSLKKLMNCEDCEEKACPHCEEEVCEECPACEN